VFLAMASYVDLPKPGPVGRRYEGGAWLCDVDQKLLAKRAHVSVRTVDRALKPLLGTSGAVRNTGHRVPGTKGPRGVIYEVSLLAEAVPLTSLEVQSDPSNGLTGLDCQSDSQLVGQIGNQLVGQIGRTRPGSPGPPGP
jgi:hypothetical protein